MGWRRFVAVVAEAPPQTGGTETPRATAEVSGGSCTPSRPLSAHLLVRSIGPAVFQPFLPKLEKGPFWTRNRTVGQVAARRPGRTERAWPGYDCVRALAASTARCRESRSLGGRRGVPQGTLALPRLPTKRTPEVRNEAPPWSRVDALLMMASAAVLLM
eukprot:COSAG02_NODE_793_length_17156_cov_54.511051_4_plen_159_part_00